jgi:hypothetical protein
VFEEFANVEVVGGELEFLGPGEADQPIDCNGDGLFVLGHAV